MSLLDDRLVILRLVAPPRAPWPGALARDVDGATLHVVDTAVIGEHWRGGDEDGGHVLGLRDIRRRPDGHDLLVDACDRALGTVVDALPVGDAGLGAAVTIAVGVLRGIHAEHVRGHGELCAGSWWVTTSGRPVFVHSAGDGMVTDGAHVIEQLAAIGGPGDLWADAAALCRVRRLDDEDLRAIEERLFAAATPAALPDADTPLARSDRAQIAPEDDDHRASWWSPLIAGVDGDVRGWAGAVRTALGRARQPRHASVSLTAPHTAHGSPLTSTAARRAPRGRLVAVAAVTAGAVAALGLLWPREAPTATPSILTPADPTPTAISTAESAPTSPSAAAASVGPTTAAEAVAALLALRRECGDESCRAAVTASAVDVPHGPVDASDAVVELIDDYGGVVAVRVTAASVAGVQLVTAVYDRQRWLLRSVVDAPQEPA